MTVFLHELRRAKIPFIIWTAVIGFMLAVCVFIFPEMKGEMESMGDMFSSMGQFTAAFGMDKLNFGTFIGYFAIECGNVLGLGGAFFAVVTGVSMLCKEEKERTAEFLLASPVSRAQIVAEKLLALFAEILAMNIIIYALCVGSTAAIGETVPFKEMTLLFLSYLLLQLELGCVCFGISAFLKKSGAGIGIGVAVMMYFLNIVSNLTDSAEFLKYVTPYGYCDGGRIVNEGSADILLMCIGICVSLVFIAAAFIKYGKKDIN